MVENYSSIVRSTRIVLFGIFIISALMIAMTSNDLVKNISINTLTDSASIAFVFWIIDRATKAKKALEEAPIRRAAISGLMAPIREFSRMIANLALDATERRPSAFDPLDAENLSKMVSFNLINVANCVTTLHGPIEWRLHYLFEIKKLSASIEKVIAIFSAHFEPHEIEIMNNCIQSRLLRTVIEYENLVLSPFKDSNFSLSVFISKPKEEFESIVVFIKWVQEKATELKIEPNNTVLPSYFDLIDKAKTQYWF